VNAVGLTNPGAHKSAELLSQLEIPEDRFLLISIFGGSIEEYVEVAKILAPVGDGLELNLSCPHAKGYGMAMGQDPQMVKDITAAVKAAVDVPVVPKLTPNVPNFREIAEAAIAGGADALCAINTVGPEKKTQHGHPVLSNEVGGVSGKEVLPRALECMHDLSGLNIPIIGCGGVSSAANVREMQAQGADVIGVGSALVGMTTDEIADYFKVLSRDLEDNTENAETLVQYDVDMDFSPVTLVKNERICEDICILTFDSKVPVKAGEFIFLWVPGLGEKPFSALTDDPFSLAVINLGQFTEAMMSLEPGTEAYVRGPHGIAISPPEGAHIMTVSGGTGLAAVHQIARDYPDTEIFFGARSKERLYFIDECKAVAPTHIATDDGSEGYHGVVTELLRQRLEEMDQAELDNLVFYNCGPEPMVHAAVKVESEFCKPGQIFNAIDYMTKCGVGICGACNSPDGRRLCVDGPFLVEES